MHYSCPKRHSNYTGKKPRWWTPELQTLRSKLRNLGKKLHDPLCKQEYKSVRKEYKKCLFNAKRDTWRKYTSSVNSPQDVSKLLKSLNKSNEKLLGLLKDSEGNYLNDPLESGMVLMARYFPGHKDISEDKNDKKCTTVKNSHLNTNVFTIHKVKSAFKLFGSFKAAGPDGFKPIVLQHLTNRAIQILTKIYQASYSTGHIAEPWRAADVVFIPKVGKDDYGDLGAFRPISLMSF